MEWLLCLELLDSAATQTIKCHRSPAINGFLVCWQTLRTIVLFESIIFALVVVIVVIVVVRLH